MKRVSAFAVIALFLFRFPLLAQNNAQENSAAAAENPLSALKDEVKQLLERANGLKRVNGAVAGRVFPIVSLGNAKDANVEDWSTYVDRTASGVAIKSILPKCPKPMIRLDDPKDYECRITLSDNAVLLGRPDTMVIDSSTGRER